MALRFYMIPNGFRPFVTSLRQTQGIQLSKPISSFNQKGNVTVVSDCHGPEVRQCAALPPINGTGVRCGIYVLPPKTTAAFLGHSSVLPHSLSGPTTVCRDIWRRSLCTSASRLAFSSGNHPPQNEQPTSGTSDGKEKTDSEAWLIRLANENGYLSWCRNVYIATVVGVTTQLQQLIPFYTETAFLFFFMGSLNLVTGTTVYIANLLKIRKRYGMSAIGVSTLSLLALVHMLLWFSAVTLYLGYTLEEEEEEEEQGKERTRIKGYIVDVRTKPDDA